MPTEVVMRNEILFSFQFNIYVNYQTHVYYYSH